MSDTMMVTDAEGGWRAVTADDVSEMMSELASLKRRLTESENGELKNALAVGQCVLELSEERKENATLRVQLSEAQERLAEIERQEPVAWRWDALNFHDHIYATKPPPIPVNGLLKLYASPVSPAAHPTQPVSAAYKSGAKWVEDDVVRDAWVAVVDREPEPMTPMLAAFREEGRSRQRVIRAVWCPAKYANTEEWNYLDDGAEYDEESDVSYWPEGWYEWNETEETHWRLHGDVTHWMPLPDVPDAALLAAQQQNIQE